jgi:excisionase family DNA binding protein
VVGKHHPLHCNKFSRMITDNSRIIDLTVGQLRELLQPRKDLAPINKIERSSFKINLKKLCEIYGFATQTVYGWVSQRYIPYSKVGRHLIFDLEEIEKWIESFNVKTRIQK